MSSSYAEHLLTEYRGKAILLDSNLLLLLVLGSFDPALVRSFKRLNEFSLADLVLLQVLALVFRMSTCPHVLTEAINVANALAEPLRRTAFTFMASTFEVLGEIHVPALQIVRRPGFEVFGLADVALSELCGEIC